jgi:hypothetical protein
MTAALFIAALLLTGASSLSEAANKAGEAIATHQKIPDMVHRVMPPACNETYLEDADRQLHEYTSGKDDAARPIAFSWHAAERYARAYADYGEHCVAHNRINDGFLRIRAAFLDADASSAARQAGDGTARAAYKRFAVVEFKKALEDPGLNDADRDDVRKYLIAADKL